MQRVEPECGLEESGGDAEPSARHKMKKARTGGGKGTTPAATVYSEDR